MTPISFTFRPQNEGEKCFFILLADRFVSHLPLDGVETKAFDCHEEDLLCYHKFLVEDDLGQPWEGDRGVWGWSLLLLHVPSSKGALMMSAPSPPFLSIWRGKEMGTMFFFLKASLMSKMWMLGICPAPVSVTIWVPPSSTLWSRMVDLLTLLAMERMASLLVALDG